MGMAALALVVALLGQVEAAPITLFNTGVDGVGAALPGGSVDPHYVLISSDDPNFPKPDAHVVFQPPGSWVANTTKAQWIAPNPVQVGDTAPAGNAAGTYIYEVTFDLGLAPTQETIIGTWAVNTIGLLYLNGVYVGSAAGAIGATNLAGPTSLTSFTIPSTANFIAGINKLDFVVVNAVNGPTGLYVGEISGNYTPGIPEPSSMVLAGLGVVGMFVYRLRRARSR